MVDNTNWPSIKEHQRIQEGSVELVDEVDVGSHCFSPLGAFLKKNSSKLRVIHDLSYPPTESVNDHIDKDSYSVRYYRVMDAVQICNSMSQAWLAKTDLKNAYFSCPIKFEERKYLGFRFQDDNNSTYNARWAALPYGLRSAAALFDLTAKGLREIYVKNGAVATSLYYLDDIITITDSKEKCQESLNVILETCKMCGFQVQESKTHRPTQCITFLGIEIDAKTKEIRLPKEKVEEISQKVKEWSNKKSATKREILSLLGKLNFCSQVVKNGNKFTRRLIECSKKGKTLNSRLKITTQTMKDIHWWQQCLRHYNGCEWFPRQLNIVTAKLTFSDASYIAIGGLCDNSWFVIPFTNGYKWLASKSMQ